MLPKLLLRLFAIVYIARFAIPALMHASAGGPFGEPWLHDRQAGTLLLNSDIRYWGVTCASIAALFAFASFDIGRHRLAVDIIMAGALAGGVIRTFELLFVGVHPLPGLVAMIFEYAFPIGWFLSTRQIRQRGVVPGSR
jgi:Domain of unknown function (DUF4345)